MDQSSDLVSKSKEIEKCEADAQEKFGSFVNWPQHVVEYITSLRNDLNFLRKGLQFHQVEYFKFEVSFELKETHYSFRAAIHRAFKPLMPLGECTRQGKTIAICFYMDNKKELKQAEATLQNFLQTRKEEIAGDPDAILRMLKREVVSFPLAEIPAIWQYSAGEDSPKAKRVLKLEESWPQYCISTPKRSKSESSDSTPADRENAHIVHMVKWSHIFDDVMKRSGRSDKYPVLKTLTIQMPQGLHRLFDKGHFYLTWLLHQEVDGSFNLELFPMEVRRMSNSDIKVLDEQAPEIRYQSIDANERVLWCQALALRKWGTIAKEYNRFDLESFERDFGAAMDTLWRS